MFQGSRSLWVFAVAAATLAAPACATGTVYSRPPIQDRDDRAFYNRGLRDGREAGADDARRGRSFDIDRHREYRDNRRGDDRGDLRAYRSGFEAGYSEAYRRFDRAARLPPPGPGRVIPGGRSDERERFVSPARDNGYRDELQAGERAARNGDRADAVRERLYREGDHDYQNRYGSRDVYKREYRDAFRQGYDDGYRRNRR